MDPDWAGYVLPTVEERMAEVCQGRAPRPVVPPSREDWGPHSAAVPRPAASLPEMLARIEELRRLAARWIAEEPARQAAAEAAEKKRQKYVAEQQRRREVRAAQERERRASLPPLGLWIDDPVKFVAWKQQLAEREEERWLAEQKRLEETQERKWWLASSWREPPPPGHAAWARGWSWRDARLDAMDVERYHASEEPELPPIDEEPEPDWKVAWLYGRSAA